jgi:hypothetical protein
MNIIPHLNRLSYSSYKQGIAMGWDCPLCTGSCRSSPLDLKVFTTQNLGRFIGTTEASITTTMSLTLHVYSNVGDMVQDYDKDTDHTLPYEGEVSLRKDENGRYALQSINDLNLELSILARKNQDSLDRKTVQKVWIEKVNSARLWEHITDVDTREVTNTIGEGEVAIVDAIAHGDDSVVMKQSEGVGINHMVRWKELSDKIYASVAEGRTLK